MSRGKQSVWKGVWYTGRKYKRASKGKKQKGGAIPIGLVASIAAPVLEEVAKLIFKRILGRGKEKRRW